MWFKIVGQIEHCGCQCITFDLNTLREILELSALETVAQRGEVASIRIQLVLRQNHE